MAMKIAKALEPFNPFWFEDPLKADNIDALAAFAASTHVATTLSETLSTRWSFREVMEKNAARVVMLDLSWCGGIGEAKKIATMAEALPTSYRATRLHRPGRACRLDPSFAKRTERIDPGIGARLLHRLVPGTGDRSANVCKRHGFVACDTGIGDGTETGVAIAPGCPHHALRNVESLIMIGAMQWQRTVRRR